MEVNGIRTRIFKEGEDLVSFIGEHLPSIPERSVLVVTSKIVALAEGRTAQNSGKRAKERLVRAESEHAFKTKWVWLTLKDGFVAATAGIDESNGNGKFIMLPKDSFAAAAKLRRALMKKYGIEKLGVVIPDSRTIPLRAGALGMAIGYAGFKGLRDYEGKKDIFGRPFKYEKAGIADSLASAATLAMGEGAERKPIALITSAPVDFTNRVNRNELFISLEDDMYLPFLSKLPRGLLKKRGRR